MPHDLLKRLLAPPDPKTRRIFYLALTVILAGLAIAHALTYGKPVFPVDDAYISLHNAQVVLAGHDERYHVSALVGATSAVHVLLVAIALLVAKPLWALWLVAWLGILAYVIGLARLAFALGGSIVEASLAIVAGLIVGQMPHQLLNGLETGWALAGLTWALAAAARGLDGRRWELPVIAGLLPFLRPELIALSGLLLLLRAYELIRAVPRDALVGELVRTAGWCLAGAAPWIAWYVIATGHVVPITIDAKRNYFAEGCLPEAVKKQWTKGSVKSFVDTIGMLAFLALLWPLSRVGRVLWIFPIVFVSAYFREFPGALGHYEQRYLYVMVPCLLVAPLSLAALVKPVGRVACCVLLIGCIVRAAPHVGERWKFHLATCDFTRHELAGVADWINANVRPDEKVLVHDAGYVGFATHARLFDLVGLKTPSSLPQHAHLTWPTCGRDRGEAVARIAGMDRPDYLVVLGGWDNIYGISAALQARGWRLDRRRNGPYVIYKLTPPR